MGGGGGVRGGGKEGERERQRCTTEEHFSDRLVTALGELI